MFGDFGINLTLCIATLALLGCLAVMVWAARDSR